MRPAFAKLSCSPAFEAHGKPPSIEQHNIFHTSNYIQFLFTTALRVLHAIPSQKNRLQRSNLLEIKFGGL